MLILKEASAIKYINNEANMKCVTFGIESPMIANNGQFNFPFAIYISDKWASTSEFGTSPWSILQYF